MWRAASEEPPQSKDASFQEMHDSFVRNRLARDRREWGGNRGGGVEGDHNCESSANRAAKAFWAFFARSASGKMLVMVMASSSSRQYPV